MANSTVIGRATFVRGRVTGTGDLEIAGRVEGEIACSGEVLVDASGLVAANIAASRIVVRGAVKGDLSAEDALVVEAGARVVGDLRAPRITIAPGALVRGHVQTANAGAGRSRTEAKATRAVEPARRAPVAAAAPPRAVNVEAPRAVKVEAPSKTHQTKAAATRQPPAPVVPVLKKGTKAVQKKRG